MYSLQDLTHLYDKKFNRNQFSDHTSGLYAPVNHILSIKGKRIRPLLLLLGCDMFGGNAEDALNPAFAVEMFHNFTLVHDDIMDNADIRRGEPTVHKLYGINTGILTGDIMLAYAYRYLTQVPDEMIPALVKVFNKTAIEIFEGQQMDMDFEKREEVSEDEYLKMIEYKTSVLLACCLQLGSIIGGAATADQRLIYDFGLKLGLSFQIMDDYLDAFGDAEKVGKRIGGDIIQNKKTFLFISAWNLSDDSQKNQLRGLLNEKNEELKINRVKELFNATGARSYALKKAGELYANALESLKSISVNEPQKQSLLLLAEKISNREF